MAKRTVQYELMYGRDAMEAIRNLPLGYLPIGCPERHGDHLVMGLDSIKAHLICCKAAQKIGGVVFPPHFYAGIHHLTQDETDRYVKEWGNIYTDDSTEKHLTDIIVQLEIIGIKTLILYTGHYPLCQREMVSRIAVKFNRRRGIHIIPFNERDELSEGGHAEICETSFMLYLHKASTRMSRIKKINYEDHGWTEENSPEKATASKGKRDVEKIIAILREKITAIKGMKT